jgi:hypothetical protein
VGRPSALKLLAEIVSVVFAVLVALGIDQWWEGRENQEMAQVSLHAITREIRENRTQLEDMGQMPPVSELMADLDSVIADFERGDRPRDASVNYDLALLSSAAWETAQLNRATQFLPLDQVVRLARLYEFQRYYERAQDEVFDALTGLRASGDDAAGEMRALKGRLGTALGFRQTLARTYACTLVEIEGPGAPETEDCPEAAEPDDEG